jgi:hypothetical protein
MKLFLRLLLTLGALAGAASIALVLWFLWLLATSPSEPDGFGQDHQEQWAVASCWREIRDGTFRSTDECSEYAQAHLDFFTDQLAADAATTTCNLSRFHLAYARRSSPDAKALLAQLKEEVRSDCSHPGVSR